MIVEQGKYQQAYDYCIKAATFQNPEAEYNLGVFMSREFM